MYLSHAFFFVPGGFVAELTLDSQQLFFFHEYALQVFRRRQYAAQASLDLDSGSLRPFAASFATTRPRWPGPKESTQAPPAGVVVGAGQTTGFKHHSPMFDFQCHGPGRNHAHTATSPPKKKNAYGAPELGQALLPPNGANACLPHARSTHGLCYAVGHQQRAQARTRAQRK